MVHGRPVDDPQTDATGYRIGRPASTEGALAAREESGGLIEAVSDAEILKAYRMVARLEGVFCEPSSAAGLAGLAKLAKRGYFKREKGARIVAVLTGHGLKDPDEARRLPAKIVSVRPELKALERLL